MEPAQREETIRARLAQLEALKSNREATRRRLLLTLIVVAAALAIGLFAAFKVVDLAAEGTSARDPLYMLIGFLGIAAIPLLYLRLNRKPDPDQPPEAAMSPGELETVIRAVKRDLEASKLVAPAASLAIAEQEEAEGALSVAPSDAGGLSLEPTEPD